MHGFGMWMCKETACRWDMPKSPWAVACKYCWLQPCLYSTRTEKSSNNASVVVEDLGGSSVTDKMLLMTLLLSSDVTKFSTLFLYLTQLFVTQSFAIASSAAYSEICQNFYNRPQKNLFNLNKMIILDNYSFNKALIVILQLYSTTSI